jgi:hypothetical protein
MAIQLVCHASGEKHQLPRIATIQGSILRGHFFHNLTNFSGGRVDQFGASGDGDRLLCSAWLQNQVQDGVLPDRQSHPLLASV